MQPDHGSMGYYHSTYSWPGSGFRLVYASFVKRLHESGAT